MLFSTKDQDHDIVPQINCAQQWKGGWWFEGCYDVFLNGPSYSASPEMKIKPVNV